MVRKTREGWLARHKRRLIVQVGFDMDGSVLRWWPTRKWAERAEREVKEGYGLIGEDVYLLGAAAPDRTKRLELMRR